MSDSILISRDGVERVQEALRAQALDGWLLYEFHHQNPIASSVLGLGKTTRRAFVLVPREGDPIALIHAIEHSAWRHWPWEIRSYSGWAEFETSVRELVEGRGTLAVETSPGNAVPTLDLVPAGVIELLRGFGVNPVSSGNLVSAFHAVWSEEQLRGHRTAAETVKAVAAEAFQLAADRVRAGAPMTEAELTVWIHEALTNRGHGEGKGCIVAIGPRAADPHYEPGEVGETINRGDVLLIDLWGRSGKDQIFADQTWMGYLGSSLPEEVETVWNAVRDSRDAGIALLRERFESGQEVRGLEIDDACRAVIEERGYGDYFVHRTGHSIDLGLHGSGPNLDNLETRDDRLLLPGVGFSIEPGIYLTDHLGMRSEVNVYWGADGPEVTPGEIQQDVFLLLDE